MSQANVYYTADFQTWYTDKARINTGTNPVSYFVNIIYPSATGNLYSQPPSVPANSSREIFVGVGNQLTVDGGAGGVTIEEIGTTTSGLYSVRQV